MCAVQAVVRVKFKATALCPLKPGTDYQSLQGRRGAQINSIKKTVIIPQGAILLWSWRARKIIIHKVKTENHDGHLTESTFTQLLRSELYACVSSSFFMVLYVSTETIRLIRYGSPGRPPRLPHSF